MPTPYYRNPYQVGTPSWVNEQAFGLSNFAGGLNNVSPDTTISDNELTDCKNMMFLGDSLMETRFGTVLASSNLDLNEPITWLDEYKPLVGESKPVVATDSAIYIDGNKLCDVEGRVRGVNYIGKYYFVDGSEMYMYDGTTYYKVLSEPMAYLSEDATTTATTYKFKKLPPQLTTASPFYVLPAVAGSTDPISKTIDSIDTANNTITVSATVGKKLTKDSPILFFTPLDKTNVQGEEVIDATTHTAYYKPCINELTDTYAGPSYFPDKPNLIASHKGRLFVAGDSEQPHGVYMTAANQPLYFPSSAGVAVKPDGNAIVDLVVFDDALIIGRHDDMYVLYGDSEYGSISSSVDPFRIKQMDVSTGFMCTSCGALLNNFYIFLGYDGRFYKLSTPTTYIEYLMTRPLERKCDIYSEPIGVNKNSLITSSVVAYRNEIYFGLNEDLVVVYNYDNMAYTYYVGWKNKCLFTDGNTLYIGRSDGKVTRWDDVDESFTDLGNVIHYKLHTKRFDCDSSINYKYFKKFMVTCHAYDNDVSEISVAVEIDYFDNPINSNINATIAKFGMARWGVDRFNNRNLYKSPYFNLDVRGRSIKFKFESNSLALGGEGHPFRLYDVNTIYSNRDVR